jgi:hypothetical protein
MGVLETDAEVDELVRGVPWGVGGLGVVVVVGEDGNVCGFDVG